MERLTVKSCGSCPFNTASMDGRYCQLIEKKLGGYAGMLGNDGPHSLCPINGDGLIITLDAGAEPENAARK